MNEETSRRLYRLEEDVSDIMERVGDQQSRQIDLLRRVMGMNYILNAMGEYREPLTLLQKLSRLWNRSHYRALENRMSEIERKTVNIQEATAALTAAAAKQDEALSEVTGKISELQTAVAALQEQVANGQIPADAQAAVEAVVAKAQALADIVKPTEPLAQG